MNEITVFQRKNFGRSSSDKLRKEGFLPAVVYNKSSHETIYLKAHDLGRNNRYDAPLCLKLDEQDIFVKFKFVQKHPVFDKILHIDFIRVS